MSSLPNSTRSVNSTITRDTGTSAANTAQTVSTSAADIVRLLFVTIKYSASASPTVTVTLNSGAGSSFDTVLSSTVMSSDTDVVFIPDEAIFIEGDDNIDVLAPAGGAGITSSVAIYTEIPW